MLLQSLWVKHVSHWPQLSWELWYQGNSLSTKKKNLITDSVASSRPPQGIWLRLCIGNCPKKGSVDVNLHLSDVHQGVLLALGLRIYTHFPVSQAPLKPAMSQPLNMLGCCLGFLTKMSMVPLSQIPWTVKCPPGREVAIYQAILEHRGDPDALAEPRRDRSSPSRMLHAAAQAHNEDLVRPGDTEGGGGHRKTLC